jgi:uncharacterized damage-inducible protein DinB
MDTIDLIKRLHQHRAWVNRNLLAAADKLTEEQLRASFPIGQGSIWKSLLHLYAAEYVWLESLLGTEEGLAPGDLPGKLPGNQLGERPLSTLSELRQNWSALEQRWIDYLAGLKPEAVDETVFRKSASLGRFGSRRSDVLLHVATHAHYTTAQVVNMLRQSGVEKLPDVMLIAMARMEAV